MVFLALWAEQEDGDPHRYIIAHVLCREVSKLCMKRHEALDETARALHVTSPKGR